MLFSGRNYFPLHWVKHSMVGEESEVEKGGGCGRKKKRYETFDLWVIQRKKIFVRICTYKKLTCVIKTNYIWRGSDIIQAFPLFSQLYFIKVFRPSHSFQFRISLISTCVKIMFEIIEISTLNITFKNEKPSISLSDLYSRLCGPGRELGWYTYSKDLQTLHCDSAIVTAINEQITFSLPQCEIRVLI